MIAADAFELQTVLRQTVIHIRQREVMLFTDQFGVLAGASTFLASLAFGGLLMSTNFLERGGRSHEFCSDLVGCDAPTGSKAEGILFNNEVIIISYYSFVTIAVFCNFVVVFISVYCLIFGPELAIRGAEKEQKRAIKGMYEERTHALHFFWAGCAFIILSGGALGWLKYPEPTAVIITAVFTMLLLWGVYYIYYHLTPLFTYVDAEGLDCSHLQNHDTDSEEQDTAQNTVSTHTSYPTWLLRRILPSRTPKSDKTAPVLSVTRDETLSEETSSSSSSTNWSNSVRSIFRSHHNTPSKPPPPRKEFYVLSKSAPLSVDGTNRHGLLEDGHLLVFDLSSGAQCLDLNLHDWTLHIDRSEPDLFILLNNSICHQLSGADFDDTQHWIRAIMANISNQYKAPAPIQSSGTTTDQFESTAKTTTNPLHDTDFFEDPGDDHARSRPTSLTEDEHKRG